MFGRKKIKKTPYNKTKEIPVIRASICNGEQVVGFKNIETGRFTEVMLIRSESDMQTYLDTYEVDRNDIVKEY